MRGRPGEDGCGGIIDDVTVYKFHDEHYMVVASSGPRKASAQWIADHAIGTSAYVTDISGGTALLSVQGPRSRDLLKTVVNGVDFDGLRFFAFADAEIAGIDALVSRDDGYRDLEPWVSTVADEDDDAIRPFW